MGLDPALLTYKVRDMLPERPKRPDSDDTDTDTDLEVPDYARVLCRRLALCLAMCDDFTTDELVRLAKRNAAGQTRIRYIVDAHETRRHRKRAEDAVSQSHG